MAQKTRRYAQLLVDLLKDAKEAEAKERVSRFRVFLKERGDLKMLNSILQEFRRLWRKRKGPVAKIVSAKELSPSLQRQMEGALSAKGFSSESVINPAVVGGFAIFFGEDYVVDGTVKAKLESLKKALSTRAAKEG